MDKVKILKEYSKELFDSFDFENDIGCALYLDVVEKLFNEYISLFPKRSLKFLQDNIELNVDMRLKNE